MTRLKLLPCLKAKCDTIWLRDMNSPFDQYVEAFWKREMKDGDTAFICDACYGKVQQVVLRRAVRESERQGMFRNAPAPDGRATEAWTDLE